MDRIGHYSIVSELGRGGMGIVYKAHEESLNRFVAIKVLGEHLTEDPTHVERFLREAQSAASLNHPNIVQIYAISEEDGKHFFVMEYVTGRSLQQILRSSGPLQPEQAARIALQTASGLRAAHEQGIIHRDIKPANLLIDDRGLLKIADFGLALVSGAVSRLTATGMFMGTPGYLSPEQCLDKEIDHRTDIYSLGVTTFEALAGKIPFTADSPLALLRQIIEVEPPDLGELAPELDPELRALVARMMAKDRNLRVASCAELIGGLETFLEKRGAGGSLVERLAGSAAGAPPPPPPPSEGDGRLETDPTMQVPSGASQADPPPPPAITAPAADTEIPVVETSPLEEPSKARGTRLALVAALVVVLGFVAVVTAGIVAWRSGLLQTIMGREPESPAVATALLSAEETTDQAAVTAPSPEEGQVVTAGERDDSATVALPAAEEPVEANENPSAAAGEAKSRGPEKLTGAQGKTQPTTQAQPDRQPPPPLIPTIPPPEGTVVIAVGETLLAGEAEAFVEASLARAGIPLVDENTVPGLATLIGSGEVPRPGEVHAMLRPYAKNLVMVRIEYLGERPLMYMGQQDVAFQARVTLVPIDVQSGSAIEAPTRFRVEYTQLNVERVVEKEFRRPTYRVTQLLNVR